MKDLTYYDLLELPAEFSEEDLRKSWRKAVLTWHPDVARGPQAAEAFKRVLVAYQTLRDPMSRRRYDATLREQNVRVGSTPRRAEPRKSVRRGSPREMIRDVRYRLRYQFTRLPRRSGDRPVQLDPLVRTLPAEELRHRVLQSRNPFVQGAAVVALRVRGESQILFEAALAAQGSALREIVRSFAGLPLRQTWPLLLSIYEQHQGEGDRSLLREMHETFDSLGRDFCRWLLERTRRQQALPGARVADVLLARMTP